MKLTENFNKAEFDSKDGSAMPENVLLNVRELAKNLEVLRAYLNAPICINSGYRSPEHNKKEGGKPHSLHLTGKASDIRVEGFTPSQIAEAIEHLIKEGKMKQGGIGTYRTFVHYDIRGVKARWKG